MELPASSAHHNTRYPGSPHRITVHRSGRVEIEAGGGASLGHQDDQSFRSSVRATMHDAGKPNGSTDYEQIRSAMSRIQVSLRPFNNNNTTLGGRAGKHSVNGEKGPDMGLGSCSRTVLLALKSLQEKIHRLESERDGALKERDLLRKCNETEREEMKHRAESQAAEALNRDTATRLARERLFADKSALEIKLLRAQEQNETISRKLDEAVASTDSETTKRLQAEEKIRSLQRRIDELVQDSTVKSLQDKVFDMESELAAECTLRQEAEIRLSALKDAKSHVDEFLKSMSKANGGVITFGPPPPVPRVAKLAKPGPSRQLATIPFLNGMKNTNKKKRVEGLTSTGRSISTMNGRSNKVDSATSLAESTQATTRNKALTSKNRGTFEREEDACRSPLPRKKVQSVAANSSPSQLRSNGPFLPPGSDKDSFNILAAVRKAVAEARRSAISVLPGEEEDGSIYAAALIEERDD